MQFTTNVSTTSDEEFSDSIRALRMGPEDASAARPSWDTTQPSTNSTPLHPEQQRPKEKLAPLETFDGTDLVRYPAWRLNTRAKLRVDGGAIGPLDDQACYVFDRLHGAAATKFRSWMDAQTTTDLDLETVFAQLDILFSDPVLAARALSWLQNTHQRSLPLDTLLPIFDQKILEAEGQFWDGSIKISMLQNALNWELLRAMVPQADTDNYVEILQPGSVWLRLGGLQVKALQSCGQRRVVPAAPRTTAAKPPRVSGISGADAAERRAQGVCINCARPGHIASRCTIPFVPVTQRPVRARDASSGSPKGPSRRRDLRVCVQSREKSNSHPQSPMRANGRRTGGGGLLRNETVHVI
ncbi:hypothetical protein ACO22_03103 [Paracoccidioides brasiliensis]|uniref:CCHC-type domain-containing protein n=1 Tax=Paracoccidioides brasiliensis TaxID=121759 RepID=A0A1D2JH02_PARBR|nr:hypothetical protein ACO22_03103 [Paracoccidioides brasiliensis]